MNNTTNYRIFVEKLPRFRVEAESLRRELNTNLNLSLGEVRLLCVYDLFGFSEELLEKSRYTVFGEVVTDSVTDTFDLAGRKYIAVEYLPGQFDQRAASAVDCVRLIDPEARVDIRSSRLLVFDDKTTDGELAKIRHYYINAVESREKDLSVLSDMEQAEVKPVGVLEGFREMADSELEPYCKTMGLAMNADDLREVVKYFRSEGRDPYETELRILDTYWSDHCRHTTFTTELEGITVEESFVKEEIEDSLALYLRIRRELGREHKSLCLMDMATIGARYLRQKGLLDDLEVSEENNACSVYIDVDVDGRTEKWLLQFKNETHNHPTEIEPFGGASTCLGGAIRDPLSGRSYVYQAMRVTGAGNIYLPVSETLSGKLPQSVISKKAAAGYSSYGNQIGLATTHVREIYHDDYVAKRLEVGAVVGAVKAANVRRERPAPGDKIIMFGGRTGRDGIGGATGSSKEHDAKSLETCGSEVQKGNAPEERKLERLFRRSEVTRLVKKSNDFGAGGVSVAIGELADGLDIYLDRVKTKYSGLNSTELAISESQERMSVVVEAKDMEEFMGYCREENIEAVHVADVTDTARMRMFNGDRKVVDLKREFIDSAGAKHYAEARIGAVENRDPFAREVAGETLAERFTNNLKDNNVVSQRGLVEMFDATIGRSTVLMPFGGRMAHAAELILPDQGAGGKKRDEDAWFDEIVATQHVLGVSAMAIQSLKDEVQVMLKLASENVEASFGAIERMGEGGIKEIEKREDAIDQMNVHLSRKVAKALTVEHGYGDVMSINHLFKIVGNIERIGDHAMNLAEYAVLIKEKDIHLSQEALGEVHQMKEVCMKALNELIDTRQLDRRQVLGEAVVFEQQIDDTNFQYRENQMERLRTWKAPSSTPRCSPTTSVSATIF